ncbi:MAG TPA: DUF2769 domain-containing protein [Desulfitobacteriaceae bacterium]|nr:DUF2769 domain-containing protein [Desulfitobacteriaceae bacterium]
MAEVPKTKENLKKCICLTCPSYTITCEMMAMPGNMILKIGNMEKIHAEIMFCAYEKSHCIDKEKSCMCSNCEVHKEYQLPKIYYCMATGGK